MSRAFTLLEMLTVVAIIGLLVALLFSVLKGVRGSSSRAQCAANLKAIGQAASIYSSENDGRIAPPNYFRVFQNAGYIATNSKVWLCPSDTRADKNTWGVGPISYAINADLAGWPPLFWDNALTRITQINSPSKTVYFSDAEAYIMRRWNPKWVFDTRRIQ